MMFPCLCLYLLFLLPQIFPFFFFFLVFKIKLKKIFFEIIVDSHACFLEYSYTPTCPYDPVDVSPQP